MNAYDTYACKGNVTASRKRRSRTAFSRLLRAVYLTICERVTMRSLRVAATLISFFAALGFVGGMECGTISGAVGITLCLVIAAAGLVTNFEE